MCFSTAPLLLKLTQVAEQLRGLTQINIQPQWQVINAMQVGESVEINERGQIAWAAGQQSLRLRQKIIVPPELRGYPLTSLSLRIVLSWWAEEAQIYINHQFVQAGDLFDSYTRILLSPSVQPGDEFEVELNLVSPGHDRGALVSSLCWYEVSDASQIDPAFLADELEILGIILNAEPHNPNLEPSLIPLLERLEVISGYTLPPDLPQFKNSLIKLRQTLQSIIPQLPSYQIRLLGHAHLDLAWLWPIAETWIVAQKTFKSVLNLQTDFPELIFCHSSPVLYEWIEQNRPDLFSQILNSVQHQTWEIAAGLWVEPDLNLINGESIVRQVLYGQHYVLEKMGQLSTVAWLPDTFGFCWQLPQIFKQGGINYFITQKLRWNDTTKFPYGLFQWQGLDGTQIMSFMTALIGERVEPVKMFKAAIDWKTQTGLNQSLWLPGVGDHGGGPTRDMLEITRRWNQSAIFPQFTFQTVTDYLQEVLNNPPVSLPIWQDELYLEFHRGCYTTHADQKRYNRRSETLLYEAELFATLATLYTQSSYPQRELETTWKQVLFNQFHDILPGSSISSVYQQANQDWETAITKAEEILQQSFDAIANFTPLPPPPQPNAQPIFIFNSLNWSRSEVVAVPIPNSDNSWEIYDSQGIAQPSQLRGERSETPQLLFLAKNVPSVGYRVYWLGVKEAETLETSGKTPYMSAPISHFTKSLAEKNEFVNSYQLEPEKIGFENGILRVIINSETGNLEQVFDLIHQRNILKPGEGNQLQAFEDSGQYWDGWNIDPNYQQHPLPSPQLKSIQWIEQGPIVWKLRMIKQFQQSDFYQDYSLELDSPLLKIETTVNWQERHILIKAAFPLTISADTASYEIPCGVIQRSTNPQTDQEKAKWEVPAIHWADISTSDYGISLLNDSKYGYDTQPNQLRLTLLRGSTWPDPEADLGSHQFSYALYPHTGDWKQAKTVQKGYEFNRPLQVKIYPAVPSILSNRTSELSDYQSFLELGSDHLILMAFKPAETQPQRWILRCYESQGEETILKWDNSLGLTIDYPVNLLEESQEISNMIISPWKIASFALSGIENG
ncbi:alpha-mannosidase [Planktothrix mougeotii]|uniref:Alpha-mannosidase n=1 Tax=Planktothrix mougeotii LEGE 06226 TaxID=1828728 RepID=A0ABR9UKX2_9CYAN|nr:alpha-mannosidase [Planktothrix mougeotii]MBE9146816.1 alpha-mannosidase [Planktothrix mougeotii LEGE 06226]